MPRTIGQAIGFLLGLWIAFALSPLWIRTASADEGLAAFADQLYEEVNRVRASHHLIPLQRRGDLDSVALAHSSDMARRGYFSHSSPEGANPLDRIESAGIRSMSLAAENLGQTTQHNATDEIVRSWLQSPEHRRNLLTPAFNTTGIGVVQGPNGALIYTQLYLSIPKGPPSPAAR